MVEAKGLNWMEICSEDEDKFVPCGHQICNPSVPVINESKPTNNPFDKYSLTGISDEVEKNVVEAVPILGQIALMGQATIIYAAPNTGKTLITLGLLFESIKLGLVEPSMVYYLNMDDTSKGLAEKLIMAEEYGFNMLSGGYKDFTAKESLTIITSMIEDNKAQGVVIILDTLKKFVNLMDKSRASGFTSIIRQFVVKGGTLIALAHTNKNPGLNGKLVYGGTSDIVDDCDCAYILTTISKEGSEKVIEFENIKRRGNVVDTAAYRYCIGQNASYAEILMSVEAVDEIQLAPVKQAEQLRSDSDIIDVIKASFMGGTNTKMKLAETVAKRIGVSRAKAINIIEKYTGDSPSIHQWQFTVKERGAKVYILLDPTTTAEVPPKG
jgi:hypothetical protein